MMVVQRGIDRATVAESAKEKNVSEPTIYAWRKRTGQIDPADVRCLKVLWLENPD